MNNFISTEKSLKRWLKNRVTVTTATVVGFLIAGTVVFGATMDINNGTKDQEVNEITNVSFQLIKTEPTTENDADEISGRKTGLRIKGKGNVSVKDINYSAEETKLTELIKIDGTSTQTVNPPEELSVDITGNIKVNTTVLDIVAADVTNNGNLTATKGIATKVNGKYGDVSFTNNGTVEAKSGYAVDITTKEGYTSTFSNNNKIVGGIVSTGDGEAKITNNGEIISQGIVGIKLTGNIEFINEKEGKITGDSSGIEKLNTEDKKENIKIINNGEITAFDYGINVDGYGSLRNEIESEIINNKKIIIDNTNEDNTAIGIYVGTRIEDKQGIIKNSGIIDIKSDSDKNVHSLVTGIRVHEKTKAENTETGIITVSGNKVSGVAVTGGAVDVTEDINDYTSFINQGKIEVKGNESIGLLVRHDAYNGNTVGEDKIKAAAALKVSAGNEETGKITITGDKVIGVKLAKNGQQNNETVNLTFANEGTITLGEKTTNGIGILVEAGEAVNKGIISLGMKDTGNQAIVNNGGTAKNSGIIQISDMTKEEILAKVDKDGAIEKLFEGNVDNPGTIVDENGIAVFEAEDAITGGAIDTDKLNTVDENKGSVTIGTGAEVQIKEGNESADLHTFNINGKATIVNDNGEVKISSDVINMTATGKMIVSDDAVLSLSNGNLNKVQGTGNETFAEAIENNGTLNLTNMRFRGNIIGDNGVINSLGRNTIDGEVAGEFNIGTGNGTEKTNVTLVTADSSYTGTINIGKDGQLVLETSGKEVRETALSNSNGITVTGTGDKDIALDISNISGKETVIDLGGSNTFNNIDVTSTLGETDGVYVIDASDLANGGDTNNVKLTYNNNLYEDNSILNNMNNHASEVSNYFSADKAERKSQLDKLYSSNIYSETVRAAYDNVKLVEDTILSLDREAVVGKWTAEGKALYSKNEYDRTGLTKDYTSEIESTGLMAALKYGVNETTTAGIAFAGVKQDVDTDAGSADGDVFYLGAFADKELGNYTLTAGAGYQLGKYDADNTAAKTSDSSYDSNAFSAYVQGKYVADLEDGLTFEPKVKLGYTYIEQDDATDSYFGVKDAELSTVDAEVGFDLVKTTQLEKAKLDVTFGASYIKAMGDTDKKFEGSFKGTAGTFDVLGAELAENTIKADLTAELTQENGFFYNAGVTYRFGSDNTKDYGANLGIGYQF